MTLYILIVFLSAFLSLILLYIYGEVLIRKEKMDLGIRVSSASLRVFFVLLPIFFIFFLWSFVFEVRKEAELALKYVENGSEFPVAPITDFPPPPDYIAIGGHYLRGPYLLGVDFVSNEEVIIAVFCLKENDPEFLYLKILSENEKLSSSRYSYDCIFGNCEKEDIYFALLYPKKEKEEEEEDSFLFGSKENKKRQAFEKIRKAESFICN